MSLLTIDSDKCIRDGHCVAECPAAIIEFKEEGASPSLVEGGREFCIACGHCVAVCPTGALTHELMAPGACAPVEKGWCLSPGQVSRLLRSRRSIRAYRDESVEREVLSEMIDVARFAPSGHNLQPVHWQVFTRREDVKRLGECVVDWMRHLAAEKSPLAERLHVDRAIGAWEAGSDRILRGAPHVVVAHALKEDLSAPAACTIALSYLEIVTASYGLGACWAGYLNAAANLWPPMAEALGLPQGHASFGALMIGVPQYRYHRVPTRNAARITWR